MSQANVSHRHQRQKVFTQAGIIYFTINSDRPVVIPPREGEAAFPTGGSKRRTDASMHRQPVWWDESYGWRSFIPLAPSFMSTPFEPLCWKPPLEAISF